MSKRRQIYDGKAKTIFEGPEPGTLIQYFKDDSSAFDDSEKESVLAGKGVLNNRISAHIMAKLEGAGIPTHFLRSLNMREQLVRQVEIIPVEIVMRNSAAGGLCKRYGIEEGMVLPQPLIEFFYKNEEGTGPLVSEQHILNFGWAWPDELDEMVHIAWRVNDYLSGLFAGIGLRLIDIKMEFGRLWGENGELYILLADEISPNTCRLWDAATGEVPDNVYRYVAEKLGLIPQGGVADEDWLDSLEEIESAQPSLPPRSRRLKVVKQAPWGKK